MSAGTVIDVFIRYKKYKGYYDQLKRLLSRSDKVSRIGNQIDTLIQEYHKARKSSSGKTFDDTEKRIRDRVDAVKSELNGMMQPPALSLGTKPKGIPSKVIDYEMDVLLGKWAGMELMRIYMAQDAGHLPPDPVPWRRLRYRFVQHRDAMIMLGREFRSAAHQIAKDIASSERGRAELERRRDEPGLTKDDIDVLSDLNDSMMEDERNMKRDKEQVEAWAAGADAAAEAFNRIIEVRDAAEKN